MREARVYFKGEPAGRLTQYDDGSFAFSYTINWFADCNKPAISLTLPKSKQKYQAETLFPFFFHLLPEGANKQVVCNALRIEKNDYFGLLLATAQVDTIGAVTVQRVGDTE